MTVSETDTETRQRALREAMAHMNAAAVEVWDAITDVAGAGEALPADAEFVKMVSDGAMGAEILQLASKVIAEHLGRPIRARM